MSTVAIVEDHGPLRVFLREAGSRTRIVVFTASSDPAEPRSVLKGGVHGIVLKEGGLPELAAGLQAVAAGVSFLSPSLPADVWHRLAGSSPREVPVGIVTARCRSPKSSAAS
jgi:DNA-binding NarL/FixJ family response regulator